ncbi:sugar phosphate isomerase/epimerase and 4-hydroxyphenylpyruvate domain-containing protein [Mobilicoccus massiliensis]|uniref:sugar phosphate isomerase/epimerase and 4-hydroxyphenylpyruvate domain-containing protein n=1 Tax=Mobilicoccus massiliensis TaxID=1522310 RepID=UPI0005917A90|nr:sugar phosphate isomerase/epimerase and 4-hydroxyphenylpyruvate domain-containing protein [Mobilicoccus massiliensis]
MRKSIATVSVSGSLPQKLAAIAAARFDGIEVFDNDLVASDLSPDEVAARCADLGLSIDLFQPLRDIEGWRPERFDAVLRRLTHKFAVMERLGVDTALACSNVQPDAVDDLDLVAEQLHAVGELAADHGVHVAYEALAWGRHINRVRQSWEAIERAGHPHVSLAVDTFHVLSRGDDAAALAGVPGDRIGFLQIADAPRLDMNVLSWSRHFRCFPGQGDLDVAGLVGAVVDAGYRGPLSLEVFSDVVRVADPRMNALDGMRSLLHLEEQLRTRRAAQAAAGEPVRALVDLFDPPPAPERVDAEFVEFAVTDDDARDTDPATSVTALLDALGFTHVATHPTRAVQWWRNGDAHVCLTTQPVPGPARSRPFVSALALRVAEVRDVATRANALLWPSVAYRRGRFTASLPGLDTPSGLHVFLTGPAGAEDDWRRVYPEPQAEHGDWFGIDHVGATVPSSRYPAEQSFYRSVFGLTGGTESEFIQPSGRLQSRPFRPTDGDLRVVLAVSADEGGRDAGVGQIAFACPDVAAVVARARAAGARFLPIPANYYDDLRARFDLDDATIEHLRTHDLMYDEDGEGGTLTHAYTQVMNGRFYLELLQREGGYTGYGAPGTHVRLAAQARL